MFDYRDILNMMIDTNLIIVISIYLISLCLYLTNKNNRIKFISYLYLSDIIIFTLLIINTHLHTKVNFSIYVIPIYTCLKLIYTIYLKNFIGIKKKYINLLIIIKLIQITTIFFTIDVYYILNIMLNLLVIKNIQIEYLTKSYKSLNNKLNKINKNKNDLYHIENQVNKGKLLKEETENKILNLDFKINKAISEVDMPIFILDSKNKIIKSNRALELEFKKSNIKNIEDINIYFDKRFINSIDALELINNTNDYEESLELYTTDEKVYKFTCIKDHYEKENVRVCILNDITQTTIIQKKLIESEEKYKKLMDILSDGVIIHDMNSIDYINEAAFNLFSIDTSKENLKIEDVKNKIHIKSIENFTKNIKFVDNNKKEKLNTKIKTKNELVLELITTKININNTSKLLTIVVDITNIEKAIGELEENRKSYKMLVQNLPEGIVVIDKKTKNYIYQNRAMIKMLKAVGIDNISKIVNDYMNNERYGIPKKYTIKEKDISSVSLTMIDVKGEEQLVGIIRCLDEEEKIKLALEELDSIKMQYEVKDNFLTTISQNLRNPIKTISTANNLLENNNSKYQSNHIHNYNELVKRNCYRLERLINNMNELVEIEKGLYSMEYVNCDIVKFLRDMINTTNKYLEDKGIEIDFKSNINKKIIQIDVDKFERIILNLLSNAIKFSDKGSPILVSIYSDDKYINISVEDNGMGIPKDKLNFIFTKFAQVDKTLTRNAEGSGVGLSIVKKLTELHGGKINVESKEGQGSKFTISLLNGNIKSKKNNILNKLNMDNEKMHIEFADIYF